MEENINILIKEKSDKGVLRLIMNNADQKNPLSESMMSMLMEEIKGASSDQSIRVIVLAATGNVFSSGHDLKELKDSRKGADKGKKYFLKIMKKCSKMMQTIIKKIFKINFSVIFALPCGRYFF